MKRFIEEKQDQEYDVVIVGGGITGAAVAYDAASRGLKTALVEKGDFGGATSAATSKLIHGGLRYLANMEVGLVRESLRERKMLENIAPNFVYPMANMIVNYDRPFKNNKWFIKIGMILYDILSFDKRFTWDRSKKIPLHTTIGRKKVLQMEPNVKKDGLTGASIYYDCISIFPERLTLAFLKSAVHHGAVVSNYAKVESFIIEKSTVRGIRVRDLLSGKERHVRGSLVINCGGPWADIILSIARGSEPDQQIRRSEGIHVITKKLVNDHIVTSMTPEGKHFFIIPWRNHSLIGTTDKEYVGSPDEWRVTKKSILELLADVNGSFGDGSSITYDDILFTYGGLRPLVEDQTEDVYESSRKYEIYDNNSDGLDGLITVEGGKYTTSRNLAEKVLDTVNKKLGLEGKDSITDKKRLTGCEIEDMDEFMKRVKNQNPDFSVNTLEYLGRHYGSECDEVLSLARKNRKLAEVVNGDGEILAEAVYAIKYEMARTLSDILFRRTGIGTLGKPDEKVLKTIASVAAKELSWTKKRLDQELAAVRARFELPADDDAIQTRGSGSKKNTRYGKKVKK